MKVESITQHTGYKDRFCDLCNKMIERNYTDSGDVCEQEHRFYKIKQDDEFFYVCVSCAKKYDNYHAKERARQKRIANKKRTEAKKKLIEDLNIKVLKKEGKKDGR